MMVRFIFALATAALFLSGPQAFAGRSLQQAVEHVESRGNPNVTGRHGEIGLMQIKCATARGLGFKGKCRDLYKPATNRLWGGKYLALAVKRAGGNLCHAASLYNMGIYARPRCTAYGRRVVEAMR
jgi:soluble lytic murein transglycosylase-like protein